MRSVEEKVEEWAKQQLDAGGVRHFAKTESINPEIDSALANAPSKRGGKGGNLPDIKVFLETKKGRRIPVLIEAKGREGDLGRTDANGALIVSNRTAKGEIDYGAINRYALNGAIHYAEAVVRGTKSYKEAIAVGVNGWQKADGTLKIELAVYYVSQNNLFVPKKIDDYADLSFLKGRHLDELIKKIDDLELSPIEKEQKTREIENAIETSLKTLNQMMRDDFHISDQNRVNLVCGLIIAGLGSHDADGRCLTTPLDADELNGEMGSRTNDGMRIYDKIESMLTARKLPEEKRKTILGILHGVFCNRLNYTPVNGESPLKTIYAYVQEKVMVYFHSKYHLDFTGRLFNVMNSWSHPETDTNNDVVLTPRYVTEFMARLCKVDRNSYVWDYAAGSAGFLVSAMKLMIEDAKKITDPDKRENKIASIKYNQLLGIEVLIDVYMLAVLNMILMEDGSANILNEDSLTEYDGNYEQGNHKGEKFPADVFLLNPPYSAAGKGFVFVEKALSRMTHGRAAVLIQENAGSGEGLPYTQEILKHSSLLASIHMADIFKGKASVRTAVYVFEVGKPHDPRQPVRFVNFDVDGYTRQNRKKSGLDVNLRDTGNAAGRYAEVVDLVLHGKRYLKLLGKDCFIEDTITLNGKDWTFAQHKKIDTTARVEDFQKVVKEYLSWKVGEIIKAEDALGKTEARV